MKKFTLLSVFLGMTSLICAQLVHVPGEYSSIQAAIDAASNGDTVIVAEGTYFENINFKGKPITVASRFILDGDTTHISRTIIDGSQFTQPDTATTVLMISGEDTTSVLLGLTITGGAGSFLASDWGGDIYTDFAGGGVAIVNSGGKICNNIIEENHVVGRSIYNYAGGIYAQIYSHHTAIIRDNIIRHNSVSKHNVYGAGIFLVGGRIIAEGNLITENNLYADEYSIGAAIYYGNWHSAGVINEVILRNNIISRNKGFGDNELGGVMLFIGKMGEESIQFYNNVVYRNYTDGFGGALYLLDTDASVYNNTILNNEAKSGGNSFAIDNNTDVVIFNNIIWSDVNFGESDFVYATNRNYRAHVFYNLLEEPFRSEVQVIQGSNTFMEPEFSMDSTFRLTENCPAIGRGIDSLLIDASWYYAPPLDLMGASRPDGVDPFVDMGALESTYPRAVTSIADLTNIGLWDLLPDPLFDRNTLDYTLSVPDTVTMVPDLEIDPTDPAAMIGINPALDLESEEAADRTTTITVTADDGTTQKIYTVLFELLSTNSFLNDISIQRRVIEPAFDPETYFYEVWLPYGTEAPPDIEYTTAQQDAEVQITAANDITSNRKDLRTSGVKVISQAGDKFQRNYWVTFNVDNNRPKISWVTDTIAPNDTIRAVCTKPGYLYLVPQNTPSDHDVILAMMLDSTAVTIVDTAWMPTSGLPPGIYWLYAINSYESISEAATVIIMSIEGIQNLRLSGLKLYPNPAGDVLYIESDVPIAEVDLFNVAGEMIMRQKYEGNSIDLGQLPRGIYFIRIIDITGDQFSGKITKN